MPLFNTTTNIANLNDIQPRQSSLMQSQPRINHHGGSNYNHVTNASTSYHPSNLNIFTQNFPSNRNIMSTQHYSPNKNVYSIQRYPNLSNPIINNQQITINSPKNHNQTTNNFQQLSLQQIHQCLQSQAQTNQIVRCLINNIQEQIGADNPNHYLWKIFTLILMRKNVKSIWYFESLTRNLERFNDMLKQKFTQINKECEFEDQCEIYGIIKKTINTFKQQQSNVNQNGNNSKLNYNQITSNYNRITTSFNSTSLNEFDEKRKQIEMMKEKMRQEKIKKQLEKEKKMAKKRNTQLDNAKFMKSINEYVNYLQFTIKLQSNYT